MSPKPNNVIGLPTLVAKGQSTPGIAKSRTPAAVGALNVIASNFTSLLNKDTRETWDDNGVTTPQCISYGAYNEIIYRSPSGAVTFGCAKSIDSLRSERKFTHNAIEMRCNALGLAVYVAGVTQIDTDKLGVKKAIRLVTYQHKKMKPEITLCMTAEDVYRQLHTILVCTFNVLGREYNIAGLTQEDLTLVSESKRMPDICISAPL